MKLCCHSYRRQPAGPCRSNRAARAQPPLEPARRPFTERSATQAELPDQPAVAGDGLLREILQQPATPSNEQEQTTTAVVVVLMLLEALGEVVDPAGEPRTLCLGRTGVALSGRVLAR